MKITWKNYPKSMYITRKALGEYPFGHIQTTTYGPKRSGKSMFCILAMMDIYSILYPEKDTGRGVDWRFNKALGNTIYSIRELIEKTESLQKRYESFEGGESPQSYVKKAIEMGFPEVAIHIDDGGVGFNKYIYFTNRGLVEELKSFMDTVGIVVTWLTVSTPSIDGVLNFVRRYEGMISHITKRSDDFRRVAKHYRVVQLPSGTQRIKRPEIDPFDAWLPTDLYKKYRVKRGRYLKENIQRLRKYQTELQNRQQQDPALDMMVTNVDQTLNELKKDNII